MILNGTYRLQYSLDGEKKRIDVTVELKQIEGLLKPRQNVYYGIATVNDKPYYDDKLPNCVNAKSKAQSIGKKLKNEIIDNCRKERKLFSIIKEEIK